MWIIYIIILIVDKQCALYTKKTKYTNDTYDAPSILMTKGDFHLNYIHLHQHY